MRSENWGCQRKLMNKDIYPRPAERRQGVRSPPPAPTIWSTASPPDRRDANSALGSHVKTRSIDTMY